MVCLTSSRGVALPSLGCLCHVLSVTVGRPVEFRTPVTSVCQERNAIGGNLRLITAGGETWAANDGLFALHVW